jgi:uncharacterized repeat protein (TIGR03806 family)
MKISMVIWVLPFMALVASCQSQDRYDDEKVSIPEFNFPKTHVFLERLSSYQLFDGELARLEPAADTHTLELVSVLFTDSAYKLRTMRLPALEQVSVGSNESFDFPDGTILTKTFFYYFDERDLTQGKRIIETRLLVKEAGLWNTATYLWNEAQTDAVRLENRLDTPVHWTDQNGVSMSIDYTVPSSNDCLVCHQKHQIITPLGPTQRNLNRLVDRGGYEVNQLANLITRGAIDPFTVDSDLTMVDYKEQSASLEDRARAYLAMNCAHCHQPGGWEAASDRDFDFRYTTGLKDSGILYSEEKLSRVLRSGDMPFIGTTMLDHEGIDLILDYLDAL